MAEPETARSLSAAVVLDYSEKLKAKKAIPNTPDKARLRELVYAVVDSRVLEAMEQDCEVVVIEFIIHSSVATVAECIHADVPGEHICSKLLPCTWTVMMMAKQRLADLGFCKIKGVVRKGANLIEATFPGIGFLM